MAHSVIPPQPHGHPRVDGSTIAVTLVIRNRIGPQRRTTMRPAASTSVLIALLLLSPHAFAGEKIQGNMVNHGPVGYDRDLCNAGFTPVVASGLFVPGVSGAKFKFDDKCKAQIQLKKMAGLPPGDGLPGTGDEVICLMNFIDSAAGSCGGFILRGEVSGSVASQKAKIKFAGSTELPGLCPPPPGDKIHITTVECYEPEPTLTYTAAGACASASGTFAPFATDPSQGLCVLSSNYVPAPPTFVLAVQGVIF